MKLYDSRRAPNPRRVRWFMAEKGIDDIEIVQVDILKNEHRTPDYLARAGLANVPALELEDGMTITESVAICRYLESLYPEPNLFGRDAELMLSTPLMMTVRHGHPALAVLEQQSLEMAERYRGQAERALKVFERRLAESAYIASDRVTMADIIAITGLDFARMVKFHPAEDLIHIARWVEAMKARPASSAGV
jgi:glutathione S-transferase